MLRTGVRIVPFVCLFAAVLPAQQDRIVAPIDARTVVLRGSAPAKAQPAFDRGAVEPDLRLGNITLMLNRSAAQQAALEELLASQQDPASPNIGEAMTRVFEHAVEPILIAPTLVYGHPMEISPLAKPMNDDPRFAERFEIFIGGMECGDNWSEQNDPIHLLAAWQRAYDAGKERAGEVHPLDYDFIEVMEYGIPPTPESVLESSAWP